MSPVKHETIIWITANLLLTGSLKTNFWEILIKIPQFSLMKNEFQNVVCSMASILIHPKCVKISWINTCYFTKPSQRDLVTFEGTSSLFLYWLSCPITHVVLDITQNLLSTAVWLNTKVQVCQAILSSLQSLSSSLSPCEHYDDFLWDILLYCQSPVLHRNCLSCSTRYMST